MLRMVFLLPCFHNADCASCGFGFSEACSWDGAFCCSEFSLIYVTRSLMSCFPTCICGAFITRLSQHPWGARCLPAASCVGCAVGMCKWGSSRADSWTARRDVSAWGSPSWWLWPNVAAVNLELKRHASRPPALVRGFFNLCHNSGLPGMS